MREAVLLERVLAGMLVDIDECPQGEELGCVRGSVPFNLSGHLIRCGPGTYRLGDVRYPYPGDGYGLLSQLVFDGAEPVVFRSRYIRSEAYTQEHKTLEERFRSLSTLSKEIGEDIGPLDFVPDQLGQVTRPLGHMGVGDQQQPHQVAGSNLAIAGITPISALAGRSITLTSTIFSSSFQRIMSTPFT